MRISIKDYLTPAEMVTVGYYSQGEVRVTKTLTVSGTWDNGYGYDYPFTAALAYLKQDCWGDGPHD